MTKLAKPLRALGSFSVAAIVTACIVQSQPAGPPPMQSGQPAGQGYGGEAPADPNGQVASAGLANGEYYCSFTVGSYSYPNFPCIVYTRRDGRQVLEKVAGSQRIHGIVDSTERGFNFQGTFFCPWGSCTEEVTARFVQSTQSVYQGTLITNAGQRSVMVRLQYLPGGLPRGYGARYYGGARYGYGYGYGGRSYGGRYGGRRGPNKIGF